MGGLLAIAVLVLYIWIWKKVFGRIQPVWGKALAFVLAILIPTGDAIYGRIVLNQMCEAEGGLRVYKTIENVDGFFESRGPNERMVRELGFEFSEGPDADRRKTVNRLTIDTSGKVILEKNVERKSTYQLRAIEGDSSMQFVRYGIVVESNDGLDVLGQFLDVNYAGGWMERALNGFYAYRGSVGTCSLNPVFYKRELELIAATLKPIKKVERKGIE